VVLYARSYLVRFYAVDGEHRARVTEVASSRSWTVANAASARALEDQILRDDRECESYSDERSRR
jgi:hypothetical protein